MAYRLHVTRFGADGLIAPIPEGEWLEFVRRSPAFVERSEITTVSQTGDDVKVRGRFGCWTEHPDADQVPFSWFDGRVSVRASDEHVVTGALVIAEALNGVVVGDDGERYLDSSTVVHEADWEFPDPDEPHPDPTPTEAPRFDAPPIVEDVPYDFDGGETLADKLMPWRRRRR